MEELFRLLGTYMNFSAPAALTAALIWGILSVLLSPCHLASIPLLIAFLSGGDVLPGKRRAVILSLSFACGLMAIIVILGLLCSALGRMAGDTGTWGAYITAAVFITAGFYMLGIISLNIGGFMPEKLAGGGMIPAFLLGLTAGLALGPCTFAFMAPVLAVCFKSAGASGMLFSGMVLLLYGIGHCGVIVAAGASAARVQAYLDMNGKTGAVAFIKKALGVLLIAAALYLIYSA